MRSLLLALVMVITGVIASSSGAVHAQPAAQDPSPPACVKDGNVDSCWSAGVAAEKRNDAAAALANYERSCAAGFQMGGCYEAGKIYFLDPARRNYGLAKDRMALVCDSDDAGIGPYACKYLGIIYRNGLTAEPQVDLAFRPLSRSCFLHNAEPFIDGNGCEILAESLPTADDMGLSDTAWQRDYIAYLAYAMGCTDDMPALCTKARDRYRRAIAASASWPARCVEQLERSPFPGTCDAVTDPGMSVQFEQRQKLRRTLVRMFRTATENPPSDG
ncbi:Uncharacterised protein [Starkeya nomas]|uniref:Beta-lactamase n=1 Tax=Starkeya nomas TaxID=2666134 RepID=A0A5S9Q5T6_9HYPH|nr:hypothetical protein [Starkeya nomas]CAA0112318.1 Uncharacterised protein [Starkeya nomas]